MIEIRDAIDPRWSGPRLGDGVFTTIRVKDAAAFDWRAHVDRLETHGAAFDLGPLPPEDVLAKAAGLRLARAGLAHGEAVLRLALWRADIGREAGGGAARSAALVIEAFRADPVAMGAARLALADEASGMIEKAAAYGARLRARDKARAAGCDDALFLDPDGRVAAAATANLFALTSGGLLTPPIGAGVVAGTARAWTARVAAELGLKTQVRPLTLDEVAAADGLFLTNARTGPAAAHLEGAPTHPDHGALARRLRALWIQRLPERRLLP